MASDMKRHTFILFAFVLLLFAGCEREAAVEKEMPDVLRWKQHEMDRPRPQAVTPASLSLPVPAPPDAVVLFDGTDLSQWEAPDGSTAPWKVENGYFEVAPGTGTIQTKGEFGDVQLHVEWASPATPRGTGQDRGNSGIMLMGGRYEVQVLDSYNAETYADGQAAALYGQYPPLFNASLPPGQWQSYDIYFRRPRFNEDGSLAEPARVTVVHNGILVQNNEELEGQTAWLKTLPYEAHPDAGPLQLQDHGSPVRFRNIWLREIPERPAPDPSYAERDRGIEMSAAELDRFTGVYHRGEGENAAPITITREGDRLVADFLYRPGVLELVPVSENEFVLTETAGRVVFQTNEQGEPTGLVFHLGGAEMPARKAE